MSDYKSIVGLQRQHERRRLSGKLQSVMMNGTSTSNKWNINFLPPSFVKCVTH